MSGTLTAKKKRSNHGKYNVAAMSVSGRGCPLMSDLRRRPNGTEPSASPPIQAVMNIALPYTSKLPDRMSNPGRRNVHTRPSDQSPPMPSRALALKGSKSRYCVIPTISRESPTESRRVKLTIHGTKK